MCVVGDVMVGVCSEWCCDVVIRVVPYLTGPVSPYPQVAPY